MKNNALLMNFSREKIVDEQAIIEQLQSGHLMGYVTDFPTIGLAEHPKVLSFPHLGASTVEAEENSAMMVVTNIRNFLEQGIIENTVNFPTTLLQPLKGIGQRISVINHNKPGVIANMTQVLSKLGYNIEQMVNTSLDKIAVNLIDIAGHIRNEDELASQFKTIDSIIRIRVVS